MIVRVFSLAMAIIGLTIIAPPAKAAWYEASSDHFVIYADDKEKDIRRFAENLERYHSALVYLTGVNIEKPSPSNRVTIFVAGSSRDIKRLAGRDNVAGFYVPRAGASRAFVQDIRFKNGYPDFSTVVLLHEYAHHFFIGSSRFAMPRWQSEGSAEFFAATTFNKDGSLILGRAAQHRRGDLSRTNLPTARELIDPELYRRNRGRSQTGFYGKSWLLYHYLIFSEERTGQLTAYQNAVMRGQSSLDAAEAAFGDLEQLEVELKSYLRGRFYTIPITAEQAPTGGEITLRRLPEGEAAVIELRMASQRGVDAEKAAEIVVDVREVAAKYPDDPGVLAALSEAEYDAGNDEAAIAAADRAITLDPARTNPYVQKGYALFRIAQNAEDKDAAYEAAMAPFSALNAIENDHPVPLIYYYRSFVQRGAAPPEQARAALERAAQLAPFDQRLWLNVGMMQAREGKIELAKRALQPLAADPHGGSRASAARRMVAALGKVPEGTQFRLRTPGSSPPARVRAEADRDETEGADNETGSGETGADGTSSDE